MSRTTDSKDKAKMTCSVYQYKHPFIGYKHNLCHLTRVWVQSLNRSMQQFDGSMTDDRSDCSFDM